MLAVSLVEKTLDAEENKDLWTQAFLISVPGTTTTVDQHYGQPNDEQKQVAEPPQDHFVLALPQVRAVPEESSLGRENDCNDILLETLDGHYDDDDTEGVGFARLVRRMSELPTTLMSELPTDVQRVELHATTVHHHHHHHHHHATIGAVGQEKSQYPGQDNDDDVESFDEIQLDVVVERKVPAIGILILVFGLFALASIGVAYRLQEGVGPLTKCYWRQMSTAVCLFPLAVRKLNLKELSALSRKEWFLEFPLISVCYAFMTAGFAVGLDMTSLANAFILSNLASVIIIVAKLVLGMPVLKLEALGTLIALTGAVVCALAPVSNTDRRLSGTSNDFDKQALAGDSICFAASFATAAYLVIAQRLRSKLDLFVFMLLLYSASTILIICFTFLVSDEQVSFSFHPVHGIFGWLNWQPDRLPLELWMAIICNIVGSTGYIAVLKYFDPVVVSVVMLADPCVATLQGVAAGVTPMPGLQTWIGDAIVIVGSVIVIFSGLRKTEHVDVNIADATANATATSDLKAAALLSPAKALKSPYRRRQEEKEEQEENRGGGRHGRSLSGNLGGTRPRDF